MSKLDKRIRQVQEAAPSNYDVEVDHIGRGLVSIVVSTEDSWWNEGEVGDGRAHIILGKRGGVRELIVRNEFTGTERNYADNMKHGRRRAWRRVLDRIRGFG